MKSKAFTIFLLALALVLSACAQPAASTPEPTAAPEEPTETAVVPTVPPAPSAPEAGQIADLKVEKDGDFLLISFAFGGAAEDYNAFHIYIDADRSPATGFQVGDIGAEFLFENAGIFSYKGDGTSWDWNDITPPDLEFEPGQNTVSWKIAVTALGLEKAAGADFVAQLVNKNWDAVGTTPKLSVEFK